MNGHDQVCLKLATSLVGAAHKVCRQVLIDRPVTATSPWDLKNAASEHFDSYSLKINAFSVSN